MSTVSLNSWLTLPAKYAMIWNFRQPYSEFLQFLKTNGGVQFIGNLFNSMMKKKTHKPIKPHNKKTQTRFYVFSVTYQFWKADNCVKTLDKTKKLKNFCPSTNQRHKFCSDSKTLEHTVCFCRAVLSAGETECAGNHHEGLLISFEGKGMHSFHLFISSTLSKKE